MRVGNFSGMGRVVKAGEVPDWMLSLKRGGIWKMAC
jgi:hypothetical protein